MAFFSVDGIITCAMWPKQLVGEQGMTAVKKWCMLPMDYDALEERIIVEGARTSTPRVLLTHPDLEAQGTLKETVICVQGVVAALEVKALGNWSDNEEHAPKAIQYLTLVGFGQGPAFTLQRDGVLHLEELVMTALGEQFIGDLGRNGAINLRCRVFERVHPCEEIKAINLTARKDPGGKAKKLSSHWVVDHRIKFGILENSGKVTVTSPLSIHHGDFVDVAAKLQIIRIRGRFSRRTEVMLCPTEVVHVCSAGDVKASIQPLHVARPSKLPLTPIVEPATSGFSFPEVDDDRAGRGGENMEQD